MKLNYDSCRHTCHLRDVVLCSRHSRNTLKWTSGHLQASWSLVSTKNPFFCGCFDKQERHGLYSRSVTCPIEHSLTSHCAFLWESLWPISLFCKCKHHIRWLQVVRNELCKSQRTSNNYSSYRAQTPLSSVLPHTFHGSIDFGSAVPLTEREPFVLTWFLIKYSLQTDLFW